MAFGKVDAGKYQVGGGMYEMPDLEIGQAPDIGMITGYWAQPPIPSPATATLDLGQPQTEVAGLLLRANLPSTITLKGPADLLFSGFTVKLTAQPLMRNLAKPVWGSIRSITGTATAAQEILLAAPARIEAVGILRVRPKNALPPAPVKVSYKEGGYFKTYVAALGLWAMPWSSQSTRTYSGYHEQAVVTDAIQLDLLDKNALLLLASPSLPSRLGLALGDDTPAQLFPSEMEDGGTVTSRDLTGQINAAWRRGGSGGPGGVAEVALRITSLTDGIVRVALDGAWGRSYVSPEQALAVDPVGPASFAVAWPFAGVSEAVASLRLTGSLEGGRRVQLVSGTASFNVRATERLEVAQAFQLGPSSGSQATPATSREVLAVWLMLPRLPKAEERVEVRLVEGAGDPPSPADEPLAAMEVTLPVDASAYVPEGNGFWYRAAFEKPVQLDGMQVVSPLFVVAAGREGGSLLAHLSQSVPPEAAQRVPGGAGAGISLVRNLDRTGTWEVQPFNRLAAQWLMDLEVAPVAEEYPALVSLAYAEQVSQAIPLAGGGRVSLETAPALVAQPGSGELSVRLDSVVRAGLRAQLLLYKPVKS